MGELRGRDDVVTAWVPKRSSGAGNQGFSILIASATMWEIGVNSVGNGCADLRSRPCKTGFCRQPT